VVRRLLFRFRGTKEMDQSGPGRKAKERQGRELNLSALVPRDSVVDVPAQS
jgi:hypothetical protein